MRESYIMVLICVAAALIVTGLILFYKYVFPKKNIHPVILIILTALPAVVSIFRPGSYESGDMFVHISRLIEFYNSLSEGNLVPQWAGVFNATYGYPILLFDAPLEYYVASLFHFIGFSFEHSIKLFLASSFILAGVSMYYFAKEQIGENPAVVAAIFYLFAPYHLVDTHFRVSVGEVSLFIFTPLLLLSINKLLDKAKFRWFFFHILIVFFTMLSSPVSLVVFTFVLTYLFFKLFQRPSSKKLLLLGLSYILGFALASFYWLPVIIDGKFTHHSQLHAIVTFQSVGDLLYKTYRFGLLYQGSYGELTFILGFTQLFVLVIGLVLLYKKVFIKSIKNQIIYFYIMLIVTCFLMLPYSTFIWESVPVYNNLQFSYRLLVIVSFLTAIIAGFVVTKIKNQKIVILLCCLAIFSTIFNWGNRGTLPEQNDQYFLKNLPYITAMGEGGDPALPIWYPAKKDQYWIKELPKSHLEVINGDAQIKELSRSSTRHEYVVNVEKKTTFKENTLYFPKWTLLVDSKERPITYNDKRHPGIIIFSLEPGVYKVELVYKKTDASQIAQIISLISLGTIALIYIIVRKSRHIKL